MKSTNPLEQAPHRTHLAGRTTRNVKESEQLLIRAPFESFGDIVGNGYSSALNLVAQTSLSAEDRLSRHREDLDGQLDARLPYGKLLEAFVSRLSDSYHLESEILLNLES
jgi:hypothetical protein